MIEVLKQLAEDVSKAYDVLAFAHTERALEILAKTRTSLRQAIAELESQEQNFCSRCGKRLGGIDSIHTCTPPQRTWLGLSDEEVFEICNSNYNRDSSLVQMVEAKLKQKNGYAEERNT